MGRNRIGDSGATQLADCLRVNATLTSLSLYQSDLGDAGAAQLVECLRVNTALTCLYLGDNNIDGVALRAACPPRCEIFM